MERTALPARHLAAFASAARLTSGSPFNSAELKTAGRKGIHAHVDVTVDPDTVSIVVKVQGKDETTGDFYDIPGAATPAIAVVGRSRLTIYPGLAETANVDVSDVVPATIRIVSTHTGGTTLTYGVSVDFLP